MKSLVLIRNDLRLDDNPSFKEAFINSKFVHALYLFSENQLKIHNESNIKISFIIESLLDLEKSSANLNVGLTVLKTNGYNDDPDQIISFFKDNNFDKLYFNNTFGVDENKRDAKIVKLFQKKNFSYQSFHDQVIFKPGSIQTNEGRPYSVFTPFKRKWLESFNLDILDIEYKYRAKEKKFLNSNIEE